MSISNTFLPRDNPRFRPYFPAYFERKASAKLFFDMINPLVYTKELLTLSATDPLTLPDDVLLIAGKMINLNTEFQATDTPLLTTL